MPLQEDQAHILRAPMPGVVKKIQCEEGDSVAEGSIIVTLEAMKMQNPLFAPKTGRVRTFSLSFLHVYTHVHTCYMQLHCTCTWNHKDMLPDLGIGRIPCK